jgi:hypothetical protein
MDAGTGVGLYGVWGADATQVWAAGGSGTIRFFNGSTWATQVSGVTVDLLGIWGSGAGDIWVVSAGGTVLRYNGTGWTPVPLGAAADLTSVTGTGPNDVWVTLPSSALFYAVHGSAVSNVVIVGNSGTIVRFDGTSWSTQTSGTTQTLHAVQVRTAGHALAVGDAGAAVHWNGTLGTATPTGVTTPPGTVTTVSATESYASGSTVNGTGYTNGTVLIGESAPLLRRNGTTWSSQPMGTEGTVGALFTIPGTSDIWAATFPGLLHKGP